MIVIDTKKDADFGNVYKFEHIDVPLVGVNGDYFLNLSEHCNFDMQRMDDEICLALSSIDLTKYPTVVGVIPPKLMDGEVKLFENDVMYNYDGNREVLKDMTAMQKRKYLFFKHKALLPWFFILDLKPNLFKTKNKNVTEWDALSEKFQYTRECIMNMPFSEVGRVVIYGSWPGAEVPCHRDAPVTGEFDHHINFNPGGYRQVYVYDSISNTKHYLPEDYSFYAYNTRDYHGVEPLIHFSYTVRVDGIYDSTKIKI
jgi:hypothetical protein